MSVADRDYLSSWFLGLGDHLSSWVALQPQKCTLTLHGRASDPIQVTREIPLPAEIGIPCIQFGRCLIAFRGPDDAAFTEPAGVYSMRLFRLKRVTRANHLGPLAAEYEERG